MHALQNAMHSAKNITLRGFAQYEPGLSEFFKSTFGFKPRINGSDLIIESRQADTAFARRLALRDFPRLELAAHTKWDITRTLLSQIPDAVEEFRPEPPVKSPIQQGFGALSDIEEILTLVTLSPRSELPGYILDRLLPGMNQHYGTTYVTGISVDAAYQQAVVSFIKIALLSERFGIDRAKTLVFQDNALAGALPTGLTVLGYVTVLTRFSPFLFTLPVQRGGCVWHFY